MNGLSLKNFHTDIVVSLLALEKKLVLMGKMFGEFSEFINSKKLNSLFIVPLINLGKN
jgi:hypothetical protein